MVISMPRDNMHQLRGQLTRSLMRLYKLTETERRQGRKERAIRSNKKRRSRASRHRRALEMSLSSLPSDLTHLSTTHSSAANHPPCSPALRSCSNLFLSPSSSITVMLSTCSTPAPALSDRLALVDKGARSPPGDECKCHCSCDKLDGCRKARQRRRGFEMLGMFAYLTAWRHVMG